MINGRIFALACLTLSLAACGNSYTPQADSHSLKALNATPCRVNCTGGGGSPEVQNWNYNGIVRPVIYQKLLSSPEIVNLLQKLGVDPNPSVSLNINDSKEIYSGGWTDANATSTNGELQIALRQDSNVIISVKFSGVGTTAYNEGTNISLYTPNLLRVDSYGDKTRLTTYNAAAGVVSAMVIQRLNNWVYEIGQLPPTPITTLSVASAFAVGSPVPARAFAPQMVCGRVQPLSLNDPYSIYTTNSGDCTTNPPPYNTPVFPAPAPQPLPGFPASPTSPWTTWPPAPIAPAPPACTTQRNEYSTAVTNEGIAGGSAFAAGGFLIGAIAGGPVSGGITLGAAVPYGSAFITTMYQLDVNTGIRQTKGDALNSCLNGH